MKKIITYGTFDLFHKGHYNILKRAKEYGDYLIVGVTGVNYDIGRGKLNVHDTLPTRIENVKNTGFADEIIVEEYLGQKIEDIIKYNIDTFVIGDDWKGKFDHLSRYCDVVYLERTKGISSTQIRKKTFEQYTIGIICGDYADDNQIINESELVNEFEVKNIYCEDKKILNLFQQKFNLENIYTSMSKLIEASDVIYVRSTITKRFDAIYHSLKCGKHVIYDPPATFKPSELKELFKLSKENKAILMENNKMVYIYVFNQLLWMTQGGLIGDILSFNCSISKTDENRSNLFYDLSAISLLPMLKIMGLNYDHANFKVKKNGSDIEFASMHFVYPNGLAIINVGNNIRVDNHVEIIGTKGTIRMKDNWWRVKNFELHNPQSTDVQVYNTNFEGNGFKYLLKSLSTMIENNRIEPMGVFEDESMKIVEILEQVKNNES